MRVFIALGSNLGDCEQNLKTAVQSINQRYSVVAQSSIMRTKAQYLENQPDFYNQVIEIKGHGNPEELLLFLHELELNMGRQRTIKYGPRLIDLDIIFFDNLIVNSKNLQIPHSLFQEREFVLRPLVEIAPNWICPKTGKSVQDFLKL